MFGGARKRRGAFRTPSLVNAELLQLSRACGVDHPSLVTLDHLGFLDGRFGATGGRELFDDEPAWGAH